MNGSPRFLSDLQMLKFLFLSLIVGLVSGENGWKVGSQYQYELGGRNMVGKGTHFNGINFKGILSVNPITETLLSLKISGAQYGNYDGELPGGWEMEISDSSLQYKPFRFTPKPFELQMKYGVVHKLIVEENIPNWEVNVIKAIASTFQVDLKTENLKKSRYNRIPTQHEPIGFYKTIEDTVTGKCETVYEVSPLAKEELENWPGVAQFKGDGQLIEVIKTQNYSDCHKKSVYHSGISGYSKWEPASAKLGQFMSRINMGRTVISGNLNEYVIQSSVIKSKILVSPHVYNTEKILIGSKINLTLESVTPTTGEPASLEKRRIIEDLVYEGEGGKQEEKKSDKFLWFGGDNKDEVKEKEMAQESNESKSQEEMEEEEWHAEKPPLEKPLLHPFEELILPDGKLEFARSLAKASKKDPITFLQLIRFIRSLNAEEIRNISDPIRAADESSWWPIRDGVALAGSGPALLVLKDWILTGKVSGEEAAELIAQLPYSVIYPTPNYIQTLYALVSSPEFEKQQYLNWTGIMTFSDILRTASVDQKEAGGMYPKYWFGIASPFNLTENYLTLMEEKLENAATQKDSNNIQLYTKAIANTGALKILSVFQPYLEGKQNLSNFQRLVMLTSLDKVAKIHPKESMNFLYKIYRNITETTEMRVAAIMHLMKTNPPVEMLQRMAELTHIDPNDQVNSAIDSAIRTAAALKTPRSTILAQNARSAVDFLSPKDYGNKKSKHFVRAFLTEEQNLGYKQELTMITNEQNFFPSSIFYYIRRQMGQYKLNYKQISAMVSSTEDLLEKILVNFKFNNETNLAFPSSLDSEKIARMMKMEVEPQPKIEGNFFFGLLGGKRFFPFNSDTISSIPEVLRNMAETIQKGYHFNYTKYYNLFTMSVGYPTITGMPFLYKIDIPTVFKLNGSIKMKTTPDIQKNLNKRDPIIIPSTIDSSSELQLMYSLKTHSETGFYTPFDQKYYFLGLDKNTNVEIPIMMKAFLDTQKTLGWVEIEPIKKNEKQKLFEQSTMLYTSRESTKFLLDPHRIESVRKVNMKPSKMYKMNIGQTGMSFDLALESEERIDKAKIMKWLRGHDLITGLFYYYAENNPTNNNLTIIYNPFTSKAHSIQFGIQSGMKNDNENFNEEYRKPIKHKKTHHKHKQFNSEKEENLAIIKDTNPLSEGRQIQFLERATQGIANSTGKVLNMFAILNGTSDSQYSAIFAQGTSIGSERSRYLLYLDSFTSHKQFQTAIDIEMKSEKVPLMNYRDAIKKSHSSDVSINIDTRENKGSWINFNVEGILKRSSERENYIRESSLGRKCELQMMEGNYILPACQRALAAARLIDQGKLTCNLKKVPLFLQKFSAKLYEWMKYFGFDYLNEDPRPVNSDNIELSFNYTANMENVNVSISTPNINSEFSNIPVDEWIEALIYSKTKSDDTEGYMHNLIYGRSVCTLDQKAVTTFKNITYPVILDKGWRIMMQHIPKSWGQELGARPEISVLVRDIHPKREIKILLSNEIIDLKPGQVTPKKGTGYEITKLSEDIVQIDAPLYSFEALFDGSRVLLQVGIKYLGEVYGLCGRMNNSSESILEDELEDSCDQHAYQIALIEDDGRLCFSVQPQIQCSNHCKPDTTTLKAIDFHCVADSSIARHWVEMVKKGGNPDLGNKATAKKATVTIPDKCVRK